MRDKEESLSVKACMSVWMCEGVCVDMCMCEMVRCGGCGVVTVLASLKKL